MRHVEQIHFSHLIQCLPYHSSRVVGHLIGKLVLDSMEITQERSIGISVHIRPELVSSELRKPQMMDNRSRFYSRSPNTLTADTKSLFLLSVAIPLFSFLFCVSALPFRSLSSQVIASSSKIAQSL